MAMLVNFFFVGLALQKKTFNPDAGTIIASDGIISNQLCHCFQPQKAYVDFQPLLTAILAVGPKVIGNSRLIGLRDMI